MYGCGPKLPDGRAVRATTGVCGKVPAGRHHPDGLRGSWGILKLGTFWAKITDRDSRQAGAIQAAGMIVCTEAGYVA